VAASRSLLVVCAAGSLVLYAALPLTAQAPSELDPDRVIAIVRLRSPAPALLAAAVGGDAVASEEQASPEHRDRLRAATDARVAAYVEASGRDARLRVADSIEAAGGRLVYSLRSVNALVAELSYDDLAALRARSDVAEVIVDEPRDSHLELTGQSLLVPAFWNAGYEGGAVDVAVIDSGLYKDHNVFASRAAAVLDGVFHASASQMANYWDVPTDPDDYLGHGTYVSGVIFSQGEVANPGRLGMAHGLDKLFNIKAGYRKYPSGGSSLLSDLMAGVDWALLSADPPEVFNYSYGATVPTDDDYYTQFWDGVVDTYGKVATLSAGNSGPGTIGSPGMAYNVVAVANIYTAGTAGRSDDTIWASSSGGPTPGGRKKPDLAAPGANLLMPSTAGPALWGQASGTSFSAPAVAGVAALIVDAGVSDPRAVKALLINSADFVSGSGWHARYGWGYVNADRAFAQRSHVVLTAVTPSGGASPVRLLERASAEATKATIVWNRHVGYAPGTLPSASGLNNVDLRLYARQSGAQRAESASAIDNVEQVVDATVESAVLAVVGGSFAAASETVALAHSGGFVPREGPSASVVVSAPADVAPGSSFTVTATVTNGGDLRGHGYAVALNLPAGFTLESGALQQTVGALDAGAQAQAAWIVRAPASYSTAGVVTATASASAYGLAWLAAAQQIVATQAACEFTVSPADVVLAAGGGTGTLQVSAPAHCAWSASTTAPWLALTSPASGTGGGAITFSATLNTAPAERSGTIEVAGRTATVRQAGVLTPTLSVTRTGSGTGTVVSAPAGIVCGDACIASLEQGTVVTLSATPALGSTFTGWSGGGCSGTATCVATITAATQVTATFALNAYSLTVVRAGSGTGSVTSTVPIGAIDCGTTCGASFSHGATVVLAAAPSPGSVFTGWSGACTGAGLCTLEMTQARSVTATFGLQSFTLSIAGSGSGAGVVRTPPGAVPAIACPVEAGTSSGGCSATVGYGSAVSLTAEAGQGSAFAGWSGGACLGTATCIVTVTANLSVSAAFTAHTLTIGQPAAGSPGPEATGAATTLSVPVHDSLEHVVHHRWSSTCTGGLGAGTFDDASSAEPAWTPPANTTPQPQSCTITVSVDDHPHGLTRTAAFIRIVPATSSDPPTPAEYRYYFAEGATVGGFFDTRFALLNLDPEGAASVSMDFQLKDTTTVLTHAFVLGPGTRTTIDVSALAAAHSPLSTLASAEFSTVIRSDRPLVADRTMSWNVEGYGSHAETAVVSPASTWYLAEGATTGDFALYYLVQNPNDEAVTFTVTYLLPSPAAPVVRSYHVGARTRTNVAVHEEPGLENVEVAAIISAPDATPIIVERAMYLTTGGAFYGAGHESAGVTALATQWFFAEGATGDFFDLFVLVANPNPSPARVTATFLFDDGTTCAATESVDAYSRHNVWVDVLVIPGCPRSLADAAVSTTITSDLPVVAERTMWWPGPTATSWVEAHNAFGATTTATRWGLADGEQNGTRGHETYILIANTSAHAGKARVTLHFEDGTTAAREVALPANSRTNVAVGAPVEAGGFGAAVVGRRFGAIIESLPVAGQANPAQLVVERAMYSNGPGTLFWAAGTDLLATRLQ
jgi:hypothetical protein